MVYAVCIICRLPYAIEWWAKSKNCFKELSTFAFVEMKESIHWIVFGGYTLCTAAL